MPMAFCPWLVLGSGKPDTPCERMHSENLSIDPEPPVLADFGLLEDPHAATESVQQIAAQTTLRRCFERLRIGTPRPASAGR